MKQDASFRQGIAGSGDRMRHGLLEASSWKALSAGAHQRWLGVILAIGFLLRASGNLYDMGYTFHPDERKYLGVAKDMMIAGTLNPGFFENPPLYTYAIHLGLYLLIGAQYATGRVASLAEFATNLSPAVAYGLARGLAALAGTATCVLLFLIGKRFGGGLAGVLAAGFYAVAFLSVRDAHFAVNDIPMVFLVTLACLFATRLLDGGRRRDLVLGGLTAGLATATKYNGAIALLPLLLACVLRESGRQGAAGPGRAGRIGREWLTLGLIALVGFLLGNPYALLESSTFLGGFTIQYELRGKMWRGQSATPVPLLALQALGIELGWPLLLFFPVAAAYCIYRGGPRAKATWLALGVILPLVLYHVSQTLFFARFLLPCTPFIALIAAWGLVALRDASPLAWTRRPLVLGAAVGLLVASPLVRSVYLDVILHRPDTRILAKAYLERVAPPGSAIVLEGSKRYYPTYTPPLDRQRYQILNLGSDPSLLDPATTSADYYVFSSFVTGRVPGILEAEERFLMAALERQGFGRIAFSPLRDGGDLPFEPDQVYLPYRHLFRYERPGPTIVIYARPRTPGPPLSEGFLGPKNPDALLVSDVLLPSPPTGTLHGRTG